MGFGSQRRERTMDGGWDGIKDDTLRWERGGLIWTEKEPLGAGWKLEDLKRMHN